MTVAENVGDEPAPARPATIDVVLERLETLQRRAEARGPHHHDDGLACANRLWTAVVREVRDRLCAGGSFVDPEFTTALVVQLTGRYLRAVDEARAGAAAPRSWRVLLDRRDAADVTPVQFVLAGVNALVHHDLAPALVSTCTVLGRTLGQTGRTDCDTFTGVVTEHLRRTVRAVRAVRAGCGADDHDAVAVVSRNEVWRLAEHLWTLRGRPVEAAAERAAIDWRVSMIGRALLAPAAP